MNMIDLDGHSHHWQLIGHSAKGKVNHRSSLHLKARDLIHSFFPTLQVLEEVPITIRLAEVLYLDFYLPLIKTCIEIHGEQHYRFVSFYHQNTLGFIKAQRRDREKTEWCEINNIKQIILPYNETVDEWRLRLNDS